MTAVGACECLFYSYCISAHGKSHEEGHSTVFGTALNYCALRILGIEADHPVAVRGRAALHKLGACVSSPFSTNP
jgi:hypothetical protein